MRRLTTALPPVLVLVLWGHVTADAPAAAVAPAPAQRTVQAAPVPDDHVPVPVPQLSPPRGPDISDLVPAKYRALVIETAARFDLDPRLLAAVGWVESRWRAGASGSAGEVGLLQILPGTADWIAREMGLERYELSDPATNVAMAAWYLRHLLDTQESVEAALAAYNAGPAWRTKAPTAARAYVDRVRAVEMR